MVGSYQEVAERMAEFHRAGIGTFVLQFQPIEPELDRFIAEVTPRLGRLVDLVSSDPSSAIAGTLNGGRRVVGQAAIP